MDVKLIKAYSAITADNVRTAFRLETFNNFYKIKKEEPNLNQRQICEKIGITETSFKRLRVDFNVKSPYRHDVSLKKSTKVRTGEGIQCDQCDNVCKNERGLATHKRMHKETAPKVSTQKPRSLKKKIKDELGFGGQEDLSNDTSINKAIKNF